MNRLLVQLSVALGGCLFLLVLVLTLPRGVPLATAVFRGTVVMCLGSVAIALFFRFLSALLHRFVAEQVLKQKEAVEGVPKNAGV